MRIAALTILCLTLALPAMSGTIYENGPINGEVDAWVINNGDIVSDTFTVSGGNSIVAGLSFGAWLYPGDTLTSVEVSITSGINGGNIYFDETVAFSASRCATNQYGFNVCTETGSFNGPTLPNGTYWLNLQNASVTNDDLIGWDQNAGVRCHSPGCPSQGWDSNEGPIPSESFSVFGSASSTTPEPNSIVLFGSGIVVGMAGMLRRKLS
jgi:hypothetical protein